MATPSSRPPASTARRPPPTSGLLASVVPRAVAFARRMLAHGAIDAARLMAFDFFLSLVPLLVLLGFILGRLVRKRGVEALVGPLLETIPDAAADVARHELVRLAGSSATPIAPLGAVTFLWLTSSGVHQMMDVFEKVTLAPPRPWLKQRAIALVTIVVGLASLSAVAWLLVAGDDLLHRNDVAVDAAPAAAPSASGGASSGQASVSSSSRAHETRASSHAKAVASSSTSSTKRRAMLNRLHAPWERLVAGGAVLLMGLIALAAFYRYAVEHPTGVRRRAWPGTFAAMASWLVVSWVFGSYLGSLGAYAVYYGSLAAVAVLLVWLFLTSLALLLGAEVNAALEQQSPG